MINGFGIPLALWPGHTEFTESFAGAALLGSSDGCALAWMILQHNVFGIELIESITIWQDPDGQINMLQILADSPNPSVPEINPALAFPVVVPPAPEI